MSRGSNRRKRKRERFTVHNSIEIYRSGKSFFDSLEKLIGEARHEIHFQTYIFDNDETGQHVADALISAAYRNVKIYLMVDSYGSANLKTTFIKTLSDAGIEFRSYGKLYSHGRFHIGRRLHRKVIVVDGCSAVIGGMNISDNYNDTGNNIAWLDFAVMVKGEIARQLQQLCKQRWLNVRFKTFSSELQDKPLPETEFPTSETLIRVTQNDFMRNKNEIARAYRAAIRNAKESLVFVGGYFLPGGKVRRLLRKATERGVEIRLIVSEKSDVGLFIHARRYLYDWLLRYHIKIFEYQPSNVHGKVLIADHKYVSIGSFDLNNLSTYSNIELNVEVSDPSFAGSLEKMLDEIILADCREITEIGLHQALPPWKRIINWASYRFVKSLFVLSIWLATSSDEK